MTKLTFVNGTPNCPVCGSRGIHQGDLLWSCQAAPSFIFHADCDVEVERAKWDFKKAIRNGRVEIVHVRKDQKITDRLSNLTNR